VVRSEVLERHPVVGRALRELGGVLSEETMRHLNYLVDAEGREISQVVTEFLKGLGA
jgi:osmoprotectant transport system permease protein